MGSSFGQLSTPFVMLKPCTHHSHVEIVYVHIPCIWPRLVFLDMYNVDDDPVSLLFLHSCLILLIVAVDKSIYLNALSVERAKGLSRSF
jgi:hypothetical protein